MKKFLCIVLVMISLSCISVYMLLYSTTRILSKDNIMATIKDVELVDIIGEENEEEIYKGLEEAGVPREYVKSIVDNEELKNVIGEYTADITMGVLEEKGMPKLDDKKLANTINEVFDIVVSEDKNNTLTKGEQEQIHQAIDEYVPQVVEEVNKNQEEINKFIDDTQALDELENNDAIKMLNTARNVYNNKNLFLWSAIGLLGIVVLLNLKEFKFIKWLAGTGILYGVTFVITSVSIPILWNGVLASEFLEYKGLVEPSINTISNTYLKTGIICLVISCIMIVIKVIINKTNKVEEKEDI